MSRYPNGKIPANLLVNVGPYHWLTAASAQRWKNLVADILKNEGVTMRITPGKNAFRDYEGQVFARKNACARGRCNDAAVAGTSSHGGEYRGRDSMAIDVQNWGVLGKDKWYAYCRKHGFEPGFFDWEPWHIIDWNPWVMPAASGGGGIEDDMPLTSEDVKRIGDWSAKQTWNGHKFKSGKTPGQVLVQLGESMARFELLTSSDASFFKHGGMKESPLWIYVMPNGDFVRIRDLETAQLYKERAGRRAVVLSTAAIRLLVSDLVESGGRDLTATSKGEVPTPPKDAENDAAFDTE